MSGKRYAEEQILRMLREIDTGASMASVSRSHGVGLRTIYGLRKKYSGISQSDLAEFKVLQEVNRCLK